MYEQISQYIKPELYILAVVLYIIGKGLKRSHIPDKYIPALLGICGVLLACIYVFSLNPQNMLAAAFSGITQGRLCAGGSVYIDQIFKQLTKKD